MFALVLYRLWTTTVVISHFPAKACVADVAQGCALSEAVNACAIADEGLACE